LTERKALLRRFDEVLEFELPDAEQVRAVIKANIRGMKYPRLNWRRIEKTAEGLSQAEISRAANEAVKNAILAQRKAISTAQLSEKLEERQAMRTVFAPQN